MNTSNGSTTRTTRRTVIGALVAMPGVAFGARAMASLKSHAAHVRPTASGTSETRCATCGDVGHSMLACPSSPEVW
jgi:threonine synthase